MLKRKLEENSREQVLVSKGFMTVNRSKQVIEREISLALAKFE